MLAPLSPSATEPTGTAPLMPMRESRVGLAMPVVCSARTAARRMARATTEGSQVPRQAKEARSVAALRVAAALGNFLRPRRPAAAIAAVA